MTQAKNLPKSPSKHFLLPILPLVYLINIILIVLMGVKKVDTTFQNAITILPAKFFKQNYKRKSCWFSHH